MRVLTEQPLIDAAIWQMERTGIHVDASFCATGLKAAATDEEATWTAIRSELGPRRTEEVFGLPYNAREGGEVSGESVMKLAALLHGDFGLKRSPLFKKGKVKQGKTALDSTAIDWIRNNCGAEWKPLLGHVLDLRKARGCIKYLKKLPTFTNARTGRVHPVFGPSSDGDDRVGAVTGRLACKLPELQQIPKDKRKDKYGIRKAFTAQTPGHVILECDYTALEVVMFSHIIAKLFGDYSLVEATKPGADDIHSVHALAVFRDHMGYDYLRGVSPKELKGHPDPRVSSCRDLIKVVWYGLMYGKGSYGFGTSLLDQDGTPIGEDRAQDILDALYTFRPGIPQYQAFVLDYIKQTGSIRSLSGRRADLSELVTGAEWQLRRAHRKALNYPMQAGGADVVGTAMYRVANSAKLRDMGFKLILQVHDALLLEGPADGAEEALATVGRIMVGAGDHWDLIPRLQAPGAFGLNWDECH